MRSRLVRPGRVVNPSAGEFGPLVPVGGCPTGDGMRMAILVEDFFEDGKYVVRSELAGLDPATDIEITIGAGFLTIRAGRSDKAEGRHRPEFRYGTFSRSVTLPAYIDEDNVTASYDNGILTVSVPLEAPEKVAARNVRIAQAT